jgi:DNA sulfur modification protein DndD
VIIEKLEMLNWGLYRGRQTLAFATPSGERVIEHIRAMNGHGKTHILNALKIGLHGAAAMKFIDDERAPQASDRQHLYAFLQRRVTTGQNTGEGPHIELILTLAETDDGVRKEIVIKRQWWLDDPSDVEEKLSILVNGEPIGEGRDAEARAEEFISEIVPAEIVQFFFFDGERIQTLADSELASGSGSPITKALDDLLGFTTMGRLKLDLNKLRGEIMQSATKNAEAAARAAQIELEIAQIKAVISRAESQLFLERDQLDEVKRLITEIRNQLPGGDGAADPATDGKLALLDRVADLREKGSRAQRAVSQSIGMELGFAIVSKVAADASERLQSEQTLREWVKRAEQVDPEADAIADALFGEDAPKPDPPLEGQQVDFLRTRLLDVWNLMLMPAPVGLPSETFFDEFSNDQVARALALLGPRVPESLASLGSQLKEVDDIQKQIQYLNDKINDVEDARERERLRKDLEDLNARRGEIGERIATLEREIAGQQEMLSQKERSLREAQSVSTGDDEIDRQRDVTQKLTDVIEEFLSSMRRSRVRDLESRMQEMLTKLAHKGDEQFARCEIDERTFGLTIYDKHDQPLHDPSAGEKELIALSMIWALGIISRRRLPLVIDTPLGRLDPEHRLAVIQQFLPHAAEQVVVLSQESEITDEYRSKYLSKYMASEQLIKWTDRVNGSQILVLPPVGGKA